MWERLTKRKKEEWKEGRKGGREKKKNRMLCDPRPEQNHCKTICISSSSFLTHPSSFFCLPFSLNLTFALPSSPVQVPNPCPDDGSNESRLQLGVLQFPRPVH